MEFLPEGTQGVVVQPIGNAGVLVAATDTVRGFGRMDQVCVWAGGKGGACAHVRLRACTCTLLCLYLLVLTHEQFRER